MTGVPPMLDRLLDDAAVFPPGNTPPDVALARHAGHRAAGYAGCIGPLLLPVSAAGRLPALVAARPDSGALAVALIARPGTDPATLRPALGELAAIPGVRAVGVEAGFTPGWAGLDVDPSLPLSLEIGRDVDLRATLEELAAAQAAGRPVLAKLRTGPTPTWRWPDEDELAAFLTATAGCGAAFKLTGGLHHAVRGRHPSSGPDPTEENHGVLNVVAATSAAAAGASTAEVSALLARRDAAPLARLVTDLSGPEVGALRALLRSVGCCEVTDPLRELAALGVLPASLAPDLPDAPPTDALTDPKG